MVGRLIAALAIGLVVGLSSGWAVKGWYTDSVNLAVSNAAKEIRDDAIGRESDIAKDVAEAAAARVPVDRIIDRGVIREIEKPVYYRVCFEPELVRLLNEGAKGRSSVEAATGKSAGPVP